MATKRFVWRGSKETKGIRRKSSRVLRQMTPKDWTTFKWEGTHSFTGYIGTVSVLGLFLAAELNVFYLKSLLWMEPEHPFVVARLAGMFLCVLPAVAEWYEYIHSPQYVFSRALGKPLLLARALMVLVSFSIAKWFVWANMRGY